MHVYIRHILFFFYSKKIWFFCNEVLCWLFSPVKKSVFVKSRDNSLIHSVWYISIHFDTYFLFSDVYIQWWVYSSRIWPNSMIEIGNNSHIGPSSPRNDCLGLMTSPSDFVQCRYRHATGDSVSHIYLLQSDLTTQSSFRWFPGIIVSRDGHLHGQGWRILETQRSWIRLAWRQK